MSETPEQKASRRIDADLLAAGWIVQSREELDLTAGRGIAVREFPMKSGFGFADYMLYLDRKAIGAIEAKAEGTLAGVGAQSAKYAAGLPDNLPAHRRPLPFLFESNGSVTFFTNGLDPTPRSRKVFNFARPETLVEWITQSVQLRARLKELPALDETGLWKVQGKAIRKLEQSFGKAAPRALIQMATGSGKTFTAVNTCYRLLKFARAKRILFLVDRSNLGKQAEDEFATFEPIDDPRKFPQLYTVQRLKSNSINPAAKVVITTIQRLFAMLRGETEFDAENEEGSAFDTAKPWAGPPPEVVYNAGIPPEYFDFIIVDECHRSIYELWSQVLLYFDSFLIGLTATPTGKTIGFFNQNLVMQYGHDEAVVDCVNVGFDVYRIRTRITESGSTIVTDPTGVFVDIIRICHDNNTFFVGRLGVYPIVLCMCEMDSSGRDSALTVATESIQVWKPSVIVMVGIAFGSDRERPKIGDVLNADRVIPYEPSRVGVERTIPRGQQHAVSPLLLNRFRNALGWSFLAPTGVACDLHFGPVLSGEKLVDNPEFKQSLLEEFPNAVGGEMEGAGLAAAAERSRCHWILVKGICDWGDGTKNKQHQGFAAAAATSLVQHVLSQEGAIPR